MCVGEKIWLAYQIYYSQMKDNKVNPFLNKRCVNTGSHGEGGR